MKPNKAIGYSVMACACVLSIAISLGVTCGAVYLASWAWHAGQPSACTCTDCKCESCCCKGGK